MLLLEFQRKHALLSRKGTAFAPATLDDFGQNLRFSDHIAAARLGIVVVLAESTLEGTVAAFLAVTFEVAILPVFAVEVAIAVEFPVTSEFPVAPELPFPAVVTRIAFFGELPFAVFGILIAEAFPTRFSSRTGAFFIVERRLPRRTPRSEILLRIVFVEMSCH